MSKWIEQFSKKKKKKTNHGKYILEEMINIFSYKWSANQNYTDIPSHPKENSYCQEKKQQMLVRTEGERNACLLWVEM
jgi:hypothetical protein